MRVLFWSELFWPYIGGAEIFATKLIPALQERGHEFIVVTRQDSPDLPTEDRYKEFPVYRFPFWTTLKGNNIDRLMALRQQVAELKRTFMPDLVHLHGCGPTSVFFHLDTVKAYRSSLLVTLINELSKVKLGVEHELVRRLLHLADWVTGKATPMLTQARELVPEIATRSSVIANGFEVPLLLPETLPFNTPRLLCLGRLAQQKGFDLALTALSFVKDRFPYVQLVIAGDGSERKKLERQVTELGLTDAVELIGWVAPDKVPELINSATMVIIPSRWEGLPSVALQAGMMARPIVAAQVGGLPEVVVQEETGLLVKPEDPKGLAEAIVFLLDRPEGARRMGQAARSRTQEVFGWKQCVDAYDALYRELGKRDAYVSAM